ncbi:hypothetical protein KL907_004342 [Ogataea polymorpha]|nr:hypothetical protein KL907_004342 [Ogataea polymorpha]KAG7907170.1 hypothetical protein KL906_004356 [Ogataea polymorpha]KAG7931239.1 hypothetical protein KL934_004360 [Ogataea polymorpha]
MGLRSEQASSPPSESDSQSDSDSITETLEQVGRLAFPTFSITPHLPTLPKLAALKRDYNTTSLGRKLAELNVKKDELARIYAQLSESLTDVVNSNLDYPVEDLHDPGGVEVLQEPEETVSLVKDRLASYDHLTYLTFEQFNDQTFLRRRIKEILSLDLLPLDQRFLIQKLMSRSYLEKQRYERAEADEPDSEAGGDEVVLGPRGVSNVSQMVHLSLLPRPGGAVAPAATEPDQTRSVHVLQHAAAGTSLLRRLQPQTERVLLRHVQVVRQRPAEKHLPLRRLRALSSRARNQPGLFPLQKLQHLHFDRVARESQVHRELDTLQLPDLRRVHVQLDQESGVHAVRPPDPPGLLRRVHEALVQVSHLLAHDRQHGAAVPRAGQGDRRDKDAGRHGRVDERGQVRRLRWQVARSVPLFGAQVRPLPELQHDAAAAAQVGPGRDGRRRRDRRRRETADHTLTERQLPVRRQTRVARRAADGRRQHRGLGLRGRLRGQLCARDQQLRKLLHHQRRVQRLDQCVETQG